MTIIQFLTLRTSNYQVVAGDEARQRSPRRGERWSAGDPGSRRRDPMKQDQREYKSSASPVKWDLRCLKAGTYELQLQEKRVMEGRGESIMSWMYLLEFDFNHYTDIRLHSLLW